MSQQIVSTLETFSQSAVRIREALDRKRQEDAHRAYTYDKQCRHWNLRERKPLNERLHQAYVGALALCEIGKSPELQKLIVETRHPHMVWGGSENLGSNFIVSAYILLGSDALIMKYDTTTIRIPYDLADPFIIHQTLQKIATPQMRTSFFFDVLKQNLAELLVGEVIFEELVNYSGPSYLERRFAVGPSPFKLIVDDELEDWHDETEE